MAISCLDFLRAASFNLVQANCTASPTAIIIFVRSSIRHGENVFPAVMAGCSQMQRSLTLLTELLQSSYGVPITILLTSFFNRQ